MQSIFDTANGTYVDVNSIVCGDISSGSWFHLQNNLYQCFGQNADGYFDAHQLSSFVGTGKSYHWFTPPPGATSVTVSVTGLEPSNKAIRIALINISLTILQSRIVSLTAAATTVTANFSALTPGTVYGFQIETTDAGQTAQPVISQVRVVPSGGTGVFAGSYTRLGVHPSWFGGTSTSSAWESALGGQFLRHHTFADVSFWTDAPRLVVESWGNTGGGTTSNIGLMVDGNGFATGALTPGPGIALDAFTLPPPVNPAGVNGHVVTVRGGVWQSAAPIGNFIRGIYFPYGYQYELLQSLANQRIIVIGDSIGLGGTTTSPHYQCWTMHLRRRYPGETLVDCYNGRSLFTDGNTAALRAVFAAGLAINQPTDIWIALGVNDYINAAWNSTNFGIGYAAMLDTLHAVMPGARIWSQSPIPKTTEGANGLGSTLPNYRTEISTAASNASRVPWSTFVDGTTSRFPAVGDLADGIHPNTLGHLKYGDAVLNILRTANVL